MVPRRALDRAWTRSWNQVLESGIGTRPRQSYLPLPEQSATMPACAGPADRSGKGMAATMTDKQVPGGQGPPSGVDRRQDRLRRALREAARGRFAELIEAEIGNL